MKLLKWVQVHTVPWAPQPEGGRQRGAPGRGGLRGLLMQAKLCCNAALPSFLTGVTDAEFFTGFVASSISAVPAALKYMT